MVTDLGSTVLDDADRRLAADVALGRRTSWLGYQSSCKGKGKDTFATGCGAVGC